MKSWRKDLGEETKKRIKLEKKLEVMKKEQEGDEKDEQSEASVAVSISSNGSPSLASVLNDSIALCTICAEQQNTFLM
jgi:hypothetical protein